ncbi:MAG: putative lipid II flippase MurJ [marine bacterium B5-7]|nr:MAG: putative lipid II flippase MurJ [marine bacterium B5-7]
MSLKLLKSTSVVGIMTLVSRISGLVRDMVFAQFLGAGLLADAFFIAFRIPNFLRRIFGEGAFTVAFVPVFSSVHEHRNPEEVRRFLALMSGRLGLILILLSLAGIVFAAPIVSILAPGYTDDPVKFAATVDTLRLTFPYLFFISLVAMSAGILNTCGRFAAAAITPVFLNISLIAAVLWLMPLLDNAAIALGSGVLIAGVVQLLFQLPHLRREGLVPRPALFAREQEKGDIDTAVGKVFRLMLPAIFGSSIAQLNVLVNTILASFLVTGSVSWLYYSDRLMEFPLGVFGVALATAILPGLSRSFANDDTDSFNRSLNVALRWTLLISIPAAAGLAILSVPLLATMFNYREFSAHDVLMSAAALRAYAVGLVGFVFVKILAPGFFARQNTATPVKIGALSMVVNLFFSLALFTWLAHVGLAVATSIAAIVNASLLGYTLKKQGVLKVESGVKRLGFQVIVATLAMMVVIWLMAGSDADWLDTQAVYRIGRLALTVVVGIAVYIATLGLLGVRPGQLVIKDA